MIRRELYPPFIATIAMLLIFTVIFLLRSNYEFVFYVVVVVFFVILLAVSDRHVKYPVWLIWLLFTWAALHMAGGGVVINGHVLYAQMLINLVGEPYLILKYDQPVHAFGFAVATLVMFYVMKPHLKPGYGHFAIGLTAFAAGIGLGAVNEIVEFFAVVVMPSTNVGGYYNLALDLVSNAVGALFAVLLIKKVEWSKKTVVKE